MRSERLRRPFYKTQAEDLLLSEVLGSRADAAFPKECCQI
jgi:hypothetical protein